MKGLETGVPCRIKWIGLHLHLLMASDLEVLVLDPMTALIRMSPLRPQSRELNGAIPS
jgi:hypothetical protein